MRRLSIRGAAGLALWRDRRGAAAIEYAFVLPVFVMLVFGLINTAQLAGAISGLHFAVQEAARCWAVNTTTCGNGAAAVAFARSRYAGPAVSPVFTASPTGCGRTVRVSANFELDIAVDILHVPLSATACYPPSAT